MDNRELDRAIAEKFLKWYEVGDWWFDPEGFITEWRIDSFNPTENPAACSLVLDEIEARGWDWAWIYHPRFLKPYGAAVTVKSRIFGEEAANRYEAVCLAALQAAEGEK